MPNRDIAIGGIVVPTDRKRALRASTVEDLAASFKTIGQLQPIVVRSHRTGFVLIAGRHRLEAARKLGWDAIACLIVEGKNADEATLIEIDENLMRADLSPAEIAAHVGARKMIYERLHPETKAKVAGGKARQGQQATTLSFAEATAKLRGLNKRSVERSAARSNAIPNVAELAGSALDTGAELDALAKLYEADSAKAGTLFNQARNGIKVSARTTLKATKRAIKERHLGTGMLALPETKYGIIVADPEWRFEPWSRETGMDRAADNHYPTSVTDAIAARPVADIAADPCVLFLWATVPMLPQALDVMKAWGFDYRSHIVWVKDRIGTGYWERNRHELLLIGVHGEAPAPAPGTQWQSVIEAPVSEHSAKPEVFLELIEGFFPTFPKIELNRRGPPRPGWAAWGNETVHDI